ncbi:unnamed protein product [marine sediment metagenome]|uniref:Uncharacterized protein n=1 Tax=marine sediment metagenome TaxID=412755 RepID=X1QIC7_9ZZZZ
MSRSRGMPPVDTAGATFRGSKKVVCNVNDRALAEGIAYPGQPIVTPGGPGS